MSDSTNFGTDKCSCKLCCGRDPRCPVNLPSMTGRRSDVIQDRLVCTKPSVICRRSDKIADETCDPAIISRGYCEFATGSSSWVPEEPREPTIPVTLEEGAFCPTRGTPNSAGLDLFAQEDTYIGPNATLVKTGVHMAIPEGYVGMIKDRSSMAYKQNITVSAGILDADYRGAIGVILTCKKVEESQPNGYQYFSVPTLSRERPMVKKGDRIAQLLIIPVCMLNCQVVDTLPDTQRGSGGFGSTGK